MSTEPSAKPDRPAEWLDRLEDTFAECFSMAFTRLIVTASSDHWLSAAANQFCGYGTSVIACDAECGVERQVKSDATPDGRDGLAILAFGFSSSQLADAVVTRAGQCLMTCPTTAVYNGLDSEKTFELGNHLRFFGDGFQKSKQLGSRRYWRIPVMDGEFVVEDRLGISKGIAGGNFIIQTADQNGALIAARTAVDAISKIPGCITPFPGGVARSGSKVGSRYKNLKASTSDAFCPTLRGRVESLLHEEATCAYEIVIDAVDEPTVRAAMRAGIEGAFSSNEGEQILRVGAGNFGGKLGKYQIELKSL